MQHSEVVGDVLLARAAKWDREGDDVLYRQLSKEAKSRFAEAINGTLRIYKHPLVAFVNQKNCPKFLLRKFKPY